MFEQEKIETIRNKELIEEHLFERGLSSEIMDNPRFDSILWKLSNIMRNMNISSNSEKCKALIDSIVTIESDGSIILIEGEGPENTIVSSKYIYDTEDEKLKRFRMESTPNGFVKTKTISIYNEDGIEESLGMEQNLEDGMYLSKATRVKDRIDVIKIERIQQNGQILNKLPEIYQIRLMWAGLEDISPDAETIDPFNRMNFNILGLPQIYRDLDSEELEMINITNNKILPLSEKDRQEQFDNYKRNNEYYGRTKAFVKGIAKYLSVKEKSLDD